MKDSVFCSQSGSMPCSTGVLKQIGAKRYDRTEERTDSRNGVRTRELKTRIGRLTQNVPRHRNQPFRTLPFENYSCSESLFSEPDSVKNLSHFLKIQMARQSVKVFVRKRTSDRRAMPCLLPKTPQQKKAPVIQINQEVLHNNLAGYYNGLTI